MSRLSSNPRGEHEKQCDYSAMIKSKNTLQIFDADITFTERQKNDGHLGFLCFDKTKMFRFTFNDIVA